jgi:hypothetical protein
MTDNQTYSCQNLEEKTFGDLPCQNCGKLVRVMLPFYGCIFCEDCIKGYSISWKLAKERKGKIKRQNDRPACK